MKCPVWEMTYLLNVHCPPMKCLFMKSPNTFFLIYLKLKGHYEFCHFDPDDNFLVMIQGRKQVR